MPEAIADYALIGDTHTAALVGRSGSIDWLCLPRFDSGAVFAALLGTEEHGHWRLAPAGGVQSIERRYVDDTLVLETTYRTDVGRARVIDFMPIRDGAATVVRIVEGVEGNVPFHMDLRLRFDYGSIMPWVINVDGDLRATAGPDAVALRTPVTTAGGDGSTVADFVVGPGDRVPFTLAWFPSHEPPPPPHEAAVSLDETLTWWRDWVDACVLTGEARDLTVRSLVTLKALTYAPTGGIVAAPTTSLPEWVGSVRNWDYRYCWLRDSVLTLAALVSGGYHGEAHAWREWLLRAAAGDPAELQIMYGIDGRRRLDEYEVDWLPGYRGSAPVRVGNAASGQFQLDVYGETLASLHLMRQLNPPDGNPLDESWPFETALLDFLEGAWREPDDGLWEMRGERQHFTHSKVMAWLAFDCAVKSAARFELPAPIDRWRTARDEVHDLVCREGYDAELGSFTQAFGSRQLDGALLQIPATGFLPATDARIAGTIAAIEQRLVRDGFVLRYDTSASDDGLPPGEGAFLPCSFWLADAYVLQGRHDDARVLFDRLSGLANDVGLFSEEYDPVSGQQLGNTPQAFTHLAFVQSARLVTQGAGAAIEF